MSNAATETPVKAPKTPKAPKEKHPCICGGFTIQDAEGVVIDSTRCDESLTSRTFAPGHDAKLKGLLIRAGASGAKVQTPKGPADPLTVAAEFGFRALVEKGIELMRARGSVTAEAKAEKAAVKAARELEKAELRAKAKMAKEAAKAAKKDGDDPDEIARIADEEAAWIEANKGKGKPAKAKVGRYIVSGTLSDDGTTFAYVDAKGNQLTVRTSAVKLID